MAYIGKQPTVGNFVKLDAITTSATATYNLTNGGVAYFPQTANNCIVSLNGVIQEPTSASNVGGFTISGSTIVFTSALTSSDVIDFILVLGDVLNIGTPSDATVGFSKVTSNLITGATAETSIAGGDSVLIYDDSASALRKMTRTNFVAGIGGVNTPNFSASRSSNGNSLTANVVTLVVFDSEQFDTDSAYSTSTGKFIVPSGKAGKYFFTGSVTMASSFVYGIAFLYKNGSEVSRGMAVQNDAGSVVVSAILDLAVADEIQLYAHSSSTQNVTSSSYFQGFKIIE